MSFGISAVTALAAAAVSSTAVAGYSAYSQQKAASSAKKSAAAASAEAQALAGENYAASLFRADDYVDSTSELFRDYEAFTALQAKSSSRDYDRAINSAMSDGERFFNASKKQSNALRTARNNFGGSTSTNFSNDASNAYGRAADQSAAKTDYYTSVIGLNKDEERESGRQLDSAQARAIALEQERYDIWADTYGSIEDNLSDFYNNITPAYYASVGLEAFQKEFNTVTSNIKQTFAQKGISPRSGIVNSVLAQADLGAAESRANIRRDAPRQAAQDKQNFLQLGIQRDSSNSFANTLNAIASQEQATDALARTQSDQFRSDQLGQLNDAYLTMLNQGNQLTRDGNAFNSQVYQHLGDMYGKGLDINQLDKEAITDLNSLNATARQSLNAIDRNNAAATRGDYSSFASNLAITAENNSGNIASGVISAGNARTDATSRAATQANTNAQNAASGFGSALSSTVSTLGNLYGEKE